MSQFEYDPEDAPFNELCVATQDPDFDLEADDACYDVVLKDDTASDPFKILDDALVHVRDANNDFNEALCSMLAHHAFLDFKTSSTGEFRGKARVRHGRLQLTPAEYFQTGSYLLDRGSPLGLEIEWFRLGLHVYIGGGRRDLDTPRGGNGLSVSFGPLGDELIGEQGAGAGLRVVLLTLHV